MERSMFKYDVIDTFKKISSEQKGLIFFCIFVVKTRSSTYFSSLNLTL